MEGKAIIINYFPDGVSQFLTAAQGMPEKVRKQIEKMIMQFVWDGSTQPPVNRETLTRPMEKEGKNILDMQAQNDAIALRQLQEYLTFGEKRPAWAYFTDWIFQNAITPSEKNCYNKNSCMNMYLQNWNPGTNKVDLPDDLKEMVSVGKKYNVRLEAMYPTRKMQEEMPIWES
ncbi:hypothetical protein CPB85DRAFT_1221721 [Mucidula mucida]|nr:hypothetical protein CPB85DRAFT_1221721 [Mucidula mucida]